MGDLLRHISVTSDERTQQRAVRSSYAKHRQAVQQAKPTFTNQTNAASSSVMIHQHSRVARRLAHNRRVNPRTTMREIEIERENQVLLKKLATIALTSKTNETFHNTTYIQKQQQKKSRSSLPSLEEQENVHSQPSRPTTTRPNTTSRSLNVLQRKAQAEQIERENYALASRLLLNRPRYTASSFEHAFQQHKYLQNTVLSKEKKIKARLEMDRPLTVDDRRHRIPATRNRAVTAPHPPSYPHPSHDESMPLPPETYDESDEDGVGTDAEARVNALWQQSMQESLSSPSHRHTSTDVAELERAFEAASQLRAATYAGPTPTLDWKHRLYQLDQNVTHSLPTQLTRLTVNGEYENSTTTSVHTTPATSVPPTRPWSASTNHHTSQHHLHPSSHQNGTSRSHLHTQPLSPSSAPTMRDPSHRHLHDSYTPVSGSIPSQSISLQQHTPFTYPDHTMRINQSATMYPYPPSQSQSQSHPQHQPQPQPQPM